MLRIELGLTVLAIIIAFIYPQVGSRWFEKLERRFAALGRRRTSSVVLVGLLALGLRAALLPVEPIPEPIVHDEFGYLLAADTFAHGHITNLTHPMWVHFETFHIIHQPTYAAQYPPMQGLFLAAGQVFFGHPFWGVWLTLGMMCSAICWMLQAWLPARWALLGGILAVLRYGVFGYWANSYWGGAAGAIGGALALGALPRIKRSQRVHDVLLMAVGLAILANSRPYEGFVFGLPIAAALVASLFGADLPLRVRRMVFLALATVLTLTIFGMGYYFWCITGNPLRMPYQVERHQYGVAPLMLWQKPLPEPLYRHAEMRKMYVDEEFSSYNLYRSHPVLGLGLKAYWGWRFFLSPLFTLPMFLAVCSLPVGFGWKNIPKPARFLIIVFAASAFGSVLESFYAPHYSSPATGLILTLLLLAMRRLRSWQPYNRPFGVFLTRAIPVLCLVMFFVRVAAGPLHIPLEKNFEFAWYQKGFDDFGRSAIQHQLLQISGKHLTIVRYKPEHEPFAEWIYNDADIDHSRIVWARELDPTENQKLISYFSDRNIWLLEPDETPPRLSPYQTKVRPGRTDVRY